MTSSKRIWRVVAIVGVLGVAVASGACDPACAQGLALVSQSNDDGSAFLTSKAATSIEWAAPGGTHATVDMDGDHVADTVTVDTGTSQVRDHRGDGDFVVQLPALAGGYSVAPAGADLDGDGRDELVLDVARTQTVPWSPIPFVTHFVEVFPGTSAPAQVAYTDAAVNDVGRVSADVTGDGRPDLQISGTYVSGAEAMAAHSGRPAGSDLIGSRADLDGDGIADTVHLGSADGSKAPRVVLSTGATLPFTDAPWPTYPTVAQSLRGSDGTAYVARSAADGTSVYRVDLCKG